MLLWFKKLRVSRAAWAGALSWWNSQVLFCRWSGSVLRTFYPEKSQNFDVECSINCLTRKNKFFVNNSLLIKETNQHWPDVACHLACLLRSRWPRNFPLTGLSFGFRIVGVNPGFVTRNDIRKKLGSLAAFSLRSKQRSSRCCFWSTLRSLGTKFDATRRIFKSPARTW